MLDSQQRATGSTKGGKWKPAEYEIGLLKNKHITFFIIIIIINNDNPLCFLIINIGLIYFQ